MKTWLRILAAAAVLSLAGPLAAQKLAPTGIAVAPQSAAPGDSVVITLTADNSDSVALAAGGSLTGTVTFTHRVTGYQFNTGSQTFVSSSAVAASGGSGTFTYSLAVPTRLTEAGAYNASVNLTGVSAGTLVGTTATSNNVLTIVGKPDLQITSITYAAGTSYVGGAVLPMTLKYRNNSATVGATNVPLTPGVNGFPAFVRIQVVLSSNPTYGDSDDFRLTIHDITSKLNADDGETTLNWNQILPGNFSGSYYVLAKIDSLNGVDENDPPALTVNGNNIWAGDTSLNPTATLVNLLPSNFPTVYTASRASGAATTANGYSDNPSMTADGRYVAFASDATNLVTGDTNGLRDVFVYDAQTNLVRRLSVSLQGTQATGTSGNPVISSADGRYVAFASEAPNLVIGDTNGFSDIFVADTLSGVLTRISGANATGGQANNPSFRPVISQTGRFIAFESTATNLTATTTAAGRSHIYLHDRDVSGSGTFDTPGNTSTVLVDTTPAGAEGDNHSIQAALSADGSTIAWTSDASNLVSGDTNGVRDVFLRPRAGTGLGATRLVSVVNGTGIQANGASQTPSLSSDGRWVAFASVATNLVAGDTNGVSDIFVHDGASSVGAPVVTRVSVSKVGAQALDPSAVGFQLGSINPTISADGRYVAFASLANNLTAGDTNGQSQAQDSNSALDVFVRDRQVSGTGNFDLAGNVDTQLVSVNAFGYQTNGVLGAPSTAASNIYPAISANGRFVVFPSDADNTGGFAYGATNLLPLDSNGVRDVFLFDRRISASVTPATPPSVGITSPGDGSSLLVNTAIRVSASASTTLGVVSSVQFFVNGASLGTSTVFPYSAVWTPTAVGSYTLSALVTDSFGNIGVSSNVRVTINAAPSVGITSPTASSALTSGVATTITASASASNPGATIANVQFYVNGAAQGILDATAPYSVAWTPPAAGSYALTAVATDSVGTQATSASVSVTVTAPGGGGGGGGPTLPVVTLVSPVNGSTLPVNVAQTLVPTASLAGGSITSVSYQANGTAVGTASVYPFTVEWKPTSPGSYSLTATATGSNGASATSIANVVAVTVGTAPAVVIASPASGATVAAGAAQTVVVSATANSGTIASVELFANGVSVGTDTSFPYNVSWTPVGVGTVALVAVATDSQGNRTPSAAVAVTVAGASVGAPSVSLTSPAAGASLPVGVAVQVAAVAADSDGTITQVEFLANGVSLGVDTTYPYSAPFTPSATGTYVLTARATDNGGNIATSAPLSVNVSGGSAPSVALDAPANNATVGVNAPVTLRATATSTSGFITGVQFFVNGVALAIDTTFPYTATWTPAATGGYVLSARATDNLGNVTDSGVVSLTVASSAAPTVTVSNPANGSAFVVGTALTLTADAADVDGTVTAVQFLVNGLPLGAPDVAAPYSAPWTPVAAGAFAITAQATDNNGNITTSAAVNLTIGANAAPTVALTSPVAGAYALGNTVLVGAAANDADGKVVSVQFFANGLSIGSAAAAPYTVTWRPPLAGNYAITAQATDDAGNVAVTSSVAIAVSAVAAPAVTITNPAAGAVFVAGNPVAFTASPAGGNGPIAQVQFFVNGASLGAPDTASPYAATWTPLAAGTYSLLAVATDSAGLSSSTAATLTVRVDGNRPPTVALSSPPAGASVNSGATVNLSAVASDPDGTVATVSYLANGNVVGTATTAPFAVAWVPRAAGSYVVAAQATDNSGNVTLSTPMTVTVIANRVPTVAVTAPGTGSVARVGTVTNLTATASDADGTVASVQFFANGVALGAADTTAPYAAAWTPAAEGVYRITALVLDNSGASALSTETYVLAVAPGAKGADTVYAGSYAGGVESGRFAAISARGTHATILAFSSSPVGRVYFHSGVPIGSSGGFTVADAAGRLQVQGAFSDTGATGTLDAGRLTFIGAAAMGSAPNVSAGLYTGGFSGRADSMLAAIVGEDGSVAAYFSDGAFRDAGASSLDSRGTFAITTAAGSRLAGVIDPSTGFLSGTLTGGPGGTFSAALSSGITFGDGTLRNLSTRGLVGTGSDVLIAGFVVAGESPKRVLVRAVGPSLTAFGMTGVLVDPHVRVFGGGTLVAENDNWGGDASVAANFAQVGAFPLNPASRDSALALVLPPGLYTAQVAGASGEAGVALVELYDLDSVQAFSSRKLINVSSRGVVGSGQGQLIAGFFVSGNTPKKILVRAVGPTLSRVPFNVPGVLADPQLRLVRGSDIVVRENDNWEVGNDAALVSDAAVRVGAFPLAAGSRDAALLLNLPPGTYSAHVTGPGTSTGIALVEVYEIP